MSPPAGRRRLPRPGRGPAVAGLALGLLLASCTSRPDHQPVNDATLPAVPETLDAKLLSAEFDRLTETKATLNAVTLLHLGKTSKPARVRLIEEARSYVFQSVPYWYDDASGRLFRDLYRQRLATTPGLDARVIVDWSSPGSTGDLFARKMYAELEEALGGKILMWNEPWWGRRFSGQLLHNRMHDKMLVVDGRKLILGGMNVGDAYLDGGVTREGWHDTDLLIEGPAAQEAARVFLKLWETSRYLASDRPFPPFEKEEVRAFRRIFKEDTFSFPFPSAVDPKTGRAWKAGDPGRVQQVEIPLAGPLSDPRTFPPLERNPSWTVPVRIVYDNPLVDRTEDGETYSKVMRSIQYLLRLSRKQALFFLPYLTPERGFVEELKAAARRGVLVAVVTNSERSHDIGKVPWKAGVALYPELAEAGVHIFEWQGHADLLELEKREGCTIPDGSWPGRTIHSKVVVVDGAYAVVGSHNMNTRSEAYNSEVMAFVGSREIARQLVEVFVEDVDLDPGKRTIPCGGRTLERPAKSEAVSVGKARSLEEEVGWKAGFLRKLRAVM